MITYNHEEFIAQAIEGVLMQQTNFPVEFILSNDASTDNTDAVIQQAIRKLPANIEVKYFSNQTNKGMMENFDFALKHCTKKYVALCEGDDYWTDALKLQQQFDALENDELAGGSFHVTSLVKDDGSSSFIGKDTKAILYTKDVFSNYSLFHTSSIVFRNSIEFPQLFWKSISWDMAFFSIVSTVGYWKKIPACMSVYRKHNRSITNNDAIVQNFRKERIRLMKLLDQYHGYQYRSVIREIIRYHRSHLKSDNLVVKIMSSFKRRLRSLSGLKRGNVSS